ncbi:MAG TPA: hypothetical protein PLD85_13055, partial [Spirochaetota bacterium]|nr:hypothetical protein [Spirochaetota bacterium]
MNIPSYYEFCNKVKCLSGHNALEKLPDILASVNSKKPMIITDKGVMGAKLITPVEKALGKIK